MKASEKQLKDFLSSNETKFIIPVYQRNYEWQKNHVRTLLGDIIKISRDNDATTHFVGSVVFIANGVYSTGDIKELSIIDGQQRLTTLTLLLIAMHKKALQDKNERLAKEIYNKYLINEYSNEPEHEKIKLKATSNNDKIVKAIMRGDYADTISETSNLIDNYEYLTDQLNTYSLEELKNGINKLIYVEISLERGRDNPQKIFESLNSTGLDLSQADLIRNYILMDLEPKEQEHFYYNYWHPIEEFTKNIKTGQSELSNFMRDFITLKFKEIPKKDKVFSTFKEKYDFYQKNTDLEEFLKELKRYAGYYARLLNSDNEKNITIQKELKNLTRLEMGVLNCFLIGAYDNFNNGLFDDRTFAKILKVLQTYVWRRFLTSRETRGLNNIIAKLYSDTDKNDFYNSLCVLLMRKKGDSIFPNDEEIKEALLTKDLYNITSKNRTYFFELLENYGTTEYVNVENNDLITIEHIFPQTPHPKWKDSLPANEYAFLVEKTNTIGNLTLTGANSNLGNKYFDEKRDYAEKGYRDSRLWLNKFLSICETWDEDNYKQRQRILTERILKIWAYPDKNLLIQYENLDKEKEINIMDVEEPTFKALDYFILFGKKEYAKTFKEFYIKVCKELYIMENERFGGEKIRQKLDAHTSLANLIAKDYSEIANKYYVFTALSAKGIFAKLAFLFDELDMEDELFVKFEDDDEQKEQ